MVDLVVWPILNARSKRAILRQKKRWGHPYEYKPRRDLLARLSEELKMTEEQVKDQIDKEREWLLEHRRYFT